MIAPILTELETGATYRADVLPGCPASDDVGPVECLGPADCLPEGWYSVRAHRTGAVTVTHASRWIRQQPATGRGRLRPGETHRAAYERLLELDRLRGAAPVVYDDWSAAVVVEADVNGQPVTACVACQLGHGEPTVLYATGAEVRGAGDGPLLVGDAVPVSDEMIAAVEAALLEAWLEVAS